MERHKRIFKDQLSDEDKLKVKKEFIRLLRLMKEDVDMYIPGSLDYNDPHLQLTMNDKEALKYWKELEQQVIALVLK